MSDAVKATKGATTAPPHVSTVGFDRSSPATSNTRGENTDFKSGECSLISITSNAILASETSSPIFFVRVSIRT